MVPPGVRRILQQTFDFLAYLRAELRQDAMPLVQAHLLDNVGALVRGQLSQDLRHAARLKPLKDRGAAAHGGLVANLNCFGHR
jgi:hypothetical protein